MDQQKSTGSLRTKISLRLGVQQRVCPFYLMKESLPAPNRLLGSKDLISYVDLGSAYQKYCQGKLKPDLASFLPQLCNTKDLCSTISGSVGLKTLYERPPITGKAIVAPNDLKGFQLAPGTVPEAYQLFDTKDVSRLIASTSAASTNPADDDSKPYDEFGRNFNDPMEEKKKNRTKLKRSLEEDEVMDGEKKSKRHKKDKKKSKKDKKREKERKESQEEARPGMGVSFY